VAATKVGDTMLVGDLPPRQKPFDVPEFKADPKMKIRVGPSKKGKP